MYYMTERIAPDLWRSGEGRVGLTTLAAEAIKGGYAAKGRRPTTLANRLKHRLGSAIEACYASRARGAVGVGGEEVRQNPLVLGGVLLGGEGVGVAGHGGHQPELDVRAPGGRPDGDSLSAVRGVEGRDGGDGPIAVVLADVGRHLNEGDDLSRCGTSIVACCWSLVVEEARIEKIGAPEVRQLEGGQGARRRNGAGHGGVLLRYIICVPICLRIFQRGQAHTSCAGKAGKDTVSCATSNTYYIYYVRTKVESQSLDIDIRAFGAPSSFTRSIFATGPQYNGVIWKYMRYVTGAAAKGPPLPDPCPRVGCATVAK